MSVTLTSEIWREIKRFINTVDQEEAAETIVNILIDNDVDAEEIKDEFKGDNHIKQALLQYLRDETNVEEEDYDEDCDEY